jgi:hypothetical protein
MLLARQNCRPDRSVAQRSGVEGPVAAFPSPTRAALTGGGNLQNLIISSNKGLSSRSGII